MAPEEYRIYIKKKAIMNAKRLVPLKEEDLMKTKKILDNF
jgi:hypothetical protein